MFLLLTSNMQLLAGMMSIKQALNRAPFLIHFLSDRLQILISCRKVIEISYIFSLVLIQAWSYISPGNMNAFISVD